MFLNSNLFRIFNCKSCLRKLSLMEYQSKQLLKMEGLNLGNFCVVDESIGLKEFENFVVDRYVVKSQIAAGGRGKGHFKNGLKGGVQLTSNKEEAKKLIQQMLGHNLITKQTSQDGLKVRTVMIEQAQNISKEAYLSFVINPQFKDPMMMICPAGGMDIETVTKENPALMRKIPIDIFEGFTNEQALEYADFFRFKKLNHPQLVETMQRLWKVFKKYDALQLEINPIAETENNKIMCLDAKINIDNNSSFRHKELFKPDPTEHPTETKAKKYGMNYIHLTGDIGCMVNGAGLAMATMDIIKLNGGEPANFLDVSGGVNEEAILHAFEILTESPQVKVILVNIFGGIVDCELIALGIIKSFKMVKVPMVVRLQGNNAERARKVIGDSGIGIDTADSFESAALKAIAHSKAQTHSGSSSTKMDC